MNSEKTVEVGRSDGASSSILLEESQCLEHKNLVQEVPGIALPLFKETRAFIKVLDEGTASKEDVARLKQKSDDLSLAVSQDNLGNF